ncbi:hypothetical protein AHAS_Ahas13G0189700 [Arachis hypogaea]
MLPVVSLPFTPICCSGMLYRTCSSTVGTSLTSATHPLTPQIGGTTSTRRVCRKTCRVQSPAYGAYHGYNTKGASLQKYSATSYANQDPLLLPYLLSPCCNMTAFIIPLPVHSSQYLFPAIVFVTNIFYGTVTGEL